MDTVLDAQIMVSTAWLDDFGAYLADRDGSAHTSKAYLSDIRIYADWFLMVNGEEFRPEFLTNTDLRAFRKWSDEQGVKPATWNRRRAALRVLWGWSKAQGYITHDVNIFDGVRTKNTGQQEPKWLDEADFRKLERHFESEFNRSQTGFERWMASRNMAAFRLMVYAGLREFEVCALMVSDIELRERSGAVQVRHGKGNKARRIPLVEEVRSALLAWFKVYEITADFGASWLFLNKNAEPMGVNAVQEMVSSAAQKCGLGHVTPHMLRHTFCHRTLSNLVRKGAGDKALITVAKMAGHSRLDVTLRYVTPSDEEMLELLEG